MKEDVRKVPLDKDGNMMGFVCCPMGVEKFLTTNTAFDSTLKFNFIDVGTNKKYEMLISEIDRVMKLEIIDEGLLFGKFGFQKKRTEFWDNMPRLRRKTWQIKS